MTTPWNWRSAPDGQNHVVMCPVGGKCPGCRAACGLKRTDFAPPTNYTRCASCEAQAPRLLAGSAGEQPAPPDTAMCPACLGDGPGSSCEPCGGTGRVPVGS